MLSIILILLLLIPTPTSSLGYLKLPRSRNLVAYEDTVWWPRTESDPEPEPETDDDTIRNQSDDDTITNEQAEAIIDEDFSDYDST